jgi:hypothetical protein
MHITGGFWNMREEKAIIELPVLELPELEVQAA